MDISQVGMQSMVALAIGAVIGIVAPLGIAIWWLVKKKENFVTYLVGVVTFCLFVFVLEKPIQNYLDGLG